MLSYIMYSLNFLKLLSTPYGLQVPRGPSRQPFFLLRKEENYGSLPRRVLGPKAPLGLERASQEGSPWEFPSSSILMGKHHIWSTSRNGSSTALTYSPQEGGPSHRSPWAPQALAVHPDSVMS